MAVLNLSPATWGWLMIMCGCCANVLSLEFITKRDKGAGHLITFAQFSFIAAEGFIQQFNFRTWRLSPRVIPWRVYALLTTLFFGASLLNNWALNFNISMPVHTVFRSSGLAGTLLTGFLFYKKRYSLHQVVSCLLVCVGICTLTLADAQVRKLAASAVAEAATASASCCGGDVAVPSALALHPPPPAAAAPVTALDGIGNSSNTSTALLPLLGPLLTTLLTALPAQSASALGEQWAALTGAMDPRWAAGIGMLTASLFMLAFLGYEQERTYARHGRAWREVLFYTHALSLPFCALLWTDIAARVRWWAAPESHAHLVLPGALSAAIGLPSGAEVRVSMFVFLAINLLTQSVCFKGVAMLTSHTNALTLSLALTLRKCVSLLLSIAYFSNPFTSAHWAGSLAVFLGILAYANENAVRRLWGAAPPAAAAAATAAAAVEVEKSAAVVRGNGLASDGECSGRSSNGNSNGSSSCSTAAEDSEADASASPTEHTSAALVAPAESPSPSPRPSLSDSPSAGLRSRSARASAAQARAAIAHVASSASSKKKKRASTAAARLS